MSLPEYFHLPVADTSWVKRSQKDISYSDQSEFQKLDFYWPEKGRAPYPTIIFVHGGAWLGCDKSDIQVLNPLTALEHGYAVVSVNYRLSWEARFPAPIDDVQEALKWVQSTAVNFEVDPDRLFLWGESAGAHLSAHLGLRSPSSFKAVVLWYCPTDFSQFDHFLAESGFPVPNHALPNSPESQFLGAPADQVSELVHQANPETWLTPEAPPFLLQHGTRDSIVPWQMSRDFAQKFETICGPGRAFVDYLEGADHGGAEFRTQKNLERVIGFLDHFQ